MRRERSTPDADRVDVEELLIFDGPSAGLIWDAPPVAEVLAQLLAEAEAVLRAGSEFLA